MVALKTDRIRKKKGKEKEIVGMIRVRRFRKREVRLHSEQMKLVTGIKKTVRSTAVIVGINVNFSEWITVRARGSLREVDFTSHRVICFHDGGDVPLFKNHTNDLKF